MVLYRRLYQHQINYYALVFIIDILIDMFVIAHQDVTKGEELTISYTNLEKSYMERRKTLENYKIHCKCERCLFFAQKVIFQSSNEEKLNLPYSLTLLTWKTV
jgi:hypothetical protein